MDGLASVASMADQQQLIPVAHWVYINMDNHEEVSLFLVDDDEEFLLKG